MHKSHPSTAAFVGAPSHSGCSWPRVIQQHTPCAQHFEKQLACHAQMHGQWKPSAFCWWSALPSCVEVYPAPERAMLSLLITFKGGIMVTAKLYMEEWSFLEPAAQSFCGAQRLLHCSREIIKCFLLENEKNGILAALLHVLCVCV